MEISETALKYHNAGLSVIPVGNDKRPCLNGNNYAWKKHTENLISPGKLFDSSYGIGLVCGKVSGNIEALDIDLKYDITGTLFNEFKELVNETSKGLLKKLVVEKTVNNGYHFIYKCKEIEGNKKLASRYVTDAEKLINPKEKEKVLLETRGDGGFIACYPTKGYKLIFGDLTKINEITTEERSILFSCAKSFNSVYDTPIVPKIAQNVIKNNISPFEDFNERGDVLQLLLSEGWKETLQKGSRSFLLRPGGTGKWSAEYHNDKRLFYVWTSSSEFENDKAYNPVQVLSTIRFNKDYSECAKWLLKEGFGDKPESKIEIKKVKSEISLQDDNFDFLADENDIEEYLTQWRNGTFVKGVSTGIPSLDKYFVLKRGNFNIINGKDNVGKSVFMWYILLLSAMYQKWSWVIYSNENRAGTVKKRMIEFYWGQKIEKLSETQFKEGKLFFEKYFTIVRNDKMFNFKDMLVICEKLNTKKKYDGILIDPYNSLKIDLSDNSKLSTHEYHYEGASEMQIFTKKHDICIYLNCHVTTFAARESKAPGKADTEGGSKFPNKADDFITLHRYTDADNWRNMEVYTRKIKETETGGSYTMADNPFILSMLEGNCGYVDSNGFNPIQEYWNKQGKQISIPNNGFLNEESERKPISRSRSEIAAEEDNEAAYEWKPD